LTLIHEACFIRMCVQMTNIASKRHENPLTGHSREGGNPEGLLRTRLDSRLRGNDEYIASQSSLTECELVLGRRLLCEVQFLDHLIANNELLDFSGRGHGKVLHEFDVTGNLVVSDLAFAELLNLVRRRSIPVF
jgi:hypothetical protein